MIKVGDIYRCNLDRNDDITPKGNIDFRPKFFVVIGTPEYGYYIAYVIVNSEININFNNTKALLDSQFPLKREDYPEIFSKETSYLNLARIRRMEAERLIAQGQYKGHLTDKDLKLVIETLQNSDLISPKEKRSCGLIP